MKIILINKNKRISDSANPQNRIANIKRDAENKLIPFLTSDIPSARIKKNQNT